ncbi:MAG: InlB B-repeat-containing protein, partial [Clostridiales bacterium]|nr:InlB B-repeat-containing protein [Clostridiales bacterium]
SIAYKFEVPEGQKVKITFGSSSPDGWWDKNFTAKCGSESISLTAQPDNRIQVHTFEGTFEGTKETYGGEEKNIVTVSFGPDGYVAWILVTTPNYALDFEEQTSCVKGGTTGSVDLMPVTPGNASANQTFYAHGTLDETEMAKINAAEDFTYVENVKVTLDDGREKTVKVLALPPYTTYFVNAGYDAAYNAAHGYGYSACVGANVRSGLENPYKTSVRYTGGKITYKFDAPAGIYTVAVASKDPWWNNNDRKITVTLNGEAKEQLSAGASNAAEPNVGSYEVTVSDTDGITLELAAPNGVSGADPVISYIWVYAMEEVIIYDTQGGSSLMASVRVPESTTAVAVTSEEPVRAGYAFLGWYTQATGGDKVEAGTEYTSPITLYAHWEEASPRNVTFKLNADDTDAYATVTAVPHGTVITAGDRPEVPTKAGYYFAGWFNGENEFDPATDLVKSDLTLVAHWNEDPLADEDGYTKKTEESATSFAVVSQWKDDVNNKGKLMYLPVGKKAIAVYTIEEGTGWNAGVVLSFLYGGTRYNCGPNTVYWFNNATDTSKGNWGSSYGDAALQACGNGGVQVGITRSDNHGSVYGNTNKKLTQYAIIELIDSTHITYTVKAYDTEALPYKEVLCQTTHTIVLPAATDEFEFRFAYDNENGTKLKTATVKYVELNNTMYTLTFDENNGSGAAPASFTQRGSTVYNVQYTPRTGYEFLGWQYDGDQLLQPGNLTVTRNYDFTAQWKAEAYTVSWSLDNGAFATTPAEKTVTFDAAVGTLPTPTRTGYTFAGWYTEATGGTKIESTTTWAIDGGDDGDTVTLYAHWTAKQYTLTLHAGDGTVTPTTYQVTYDAVVGTLPEPTLTGYTFDGWYKEEAYTTLIESTTTWSYTDVTELYAKWTAKEYTITWDANGGTLADGTTATSITFGSSLTLPGDPTNGEQVFIGWNTEADGSGATIDAGTLTVDLGEGAVTAYAQWASDGDMVRTVSYDLNYDGANNTISDKKVVVGGTIAVLPAPTRTGYTLEGWYTDAACTEKFVAGTTTVTEDLTLYANWTARQYTLTLNAGDGTVTPATYQVTYAAEVGELPTPTLTGYTFTGWYTAATEGTKIESDTVWNYTTVLTLYARWTLTEYTVTFDSQGGSAVASATAHYDETIDKPTDPTREGYTFGGWYKEAACTTAWDFENDTITGNVTLYAKWTANAPVITEYTVTFDSQGGSAVASATVASGNKVTKPTDPTREGYTFGGWYKDADCTESWNFDT